MKKGQKLNGASVLFDNLIEVGLGRDRISLKRQCGPTSLPYSPDSITPVTKAVLGVCPFPGPRSQGRQFCVHSKPQTLSNTFP